MKQRCIFTSLFLFIFCLGAFQGLSQSTDSSSIAQKTENLDRTTRPDMSGLNGYLIYGRIINGDTVMHMDLPQVNIVPPFEFKSPRQRKRYSRLVRYVKKVYPYAQIIRQTYYELEEQLDTIDDKRIRKKFIKKQEKKMRAQFEKQLRKLTVLQGRILLKLVDRETGQTTYEVLEEYKGKFSAIFWQSVARIFGSNLKDDYDAKGDERMIEHIILRIESGQL